MGTYLKGILGSFSGKVGTVIGSSWNGIHYMRSLPRPSSKEATAAQMDVREKFSMATGFVSPIRALFDFGYRSVVGKTGANAALSQVITECITGTSGAFVFDYPTILISKGSLTGLQNAVATGGTGVATLNWSSTLAGNAKATDKLVYLVYSPALGESTYITGGAARSLGTYEIQLPAFAGSQVELWAAFVSDDGKSISTSVHAGTVNVA